MMCRKWASLELAAKGDNSKADSTFRSSLERFKSLGIDEGRQQKVERDYIPSLVVNAASKLISTGSYSGQVEQWSWPAA